MPCASAAGADAATSHSSFYNPNGAEVDGKPWLFVVGGAYHDRLVRTAEGWRIAHRVEETLWWDNPMPGLPATRLSGSRRRLLVAPRSAGSVGGGQVVVRCRKSHDAPAVETARMPAQYAMAIMAS